VARSWSERYLLFHTGPRFADLHCHSICSDGTFSPEQLVEEAVSRKLKALAITDHDRIDSYELALPTARTSSLILGTGVEFSAFWLGTSVHVLGYDFLPGADSLKALVARHAARREQRNRAILERMKGRGLSCSYKELQQKFPGAILGRPHIAAWLIEQGVVTDFQQAFQLYLREGGLVYVAGETISVEETIQAIHDGGGKAVLAHPHLAEKGNMVKRLLDQCPFDGIEVYYGKFAESVCQRWVEMARKRKLLMTGGSDFHGSVKPFLSLGSSWVDEERFWQLFSNLRAGLYGSI